jgi:uncharacterized protein (TIGR03083 family)
MNDHLTDVTSVRPLGHDDAMALLATELERTLALLRTLTPDEWRAPTDCPAWSVHEMYLHVLGACETASVRENLHQLRAARRRQRRDGGPLEASLSAVQVEERRHLSPEALVERFDAQAPRTLRGRTRLPALLRRVSIAVDGPVVERWTLGYLVDTIYLRDLWMHRIDACRAVGRPIDLSPAHDGRIVADVVAEWARRHGRPFRLELLGPAGGSFAAPSATPSESPDALESDAVSWCRTLAGRTPGEGLLATIVPF